MCKPFADNRKQEDSELIWKEQYWDWGVGARYFSGTNIYVMRDKLSIAVGDEMHGWRHTDTPSTCHAKENH